MNTTTEHLSLSYRAITPRLGAELIGVNLLDMSDAEVAALQQIAAERGVVVVRDQVMTLAQQANFVHRLGIPTLYPVKDPAVPPELITIHADEKSKRVAGEGWHSDISSERNPPSIPKFSNARSTSRLSASISRIGFQVVNIMVNPPFVFLSLSTLRLLCCLLPRLRGLHFAKSNHCANRSKDLSEGAYRS